MIYKALRSAIILLFSIIVSLQTFAQTSPVMVNTLLGYPASVYLPDYYQSGLNKLTANLILNDFNEPSRDVYLNIRIESQDIKIQTKLEYYPSVPITLYPGELVAYTGSDLEEYLSYNNIIIEGITSQQLISRRGRLPEGLYTFCVEAYDYATRRLLSNTSCQVVHLAQYEPPNLLFPEKGGIIAPNSAQNIVFQWINTAPINPSELNYKFIIYELIDPYADPMQAIDNNQAIIIHEEEITTPIFNYNISHPLLETGKTYIYRVQAFTLDGKTQFKNDGYSEPSFFYYGYPGNGTIKQLVPEQNGTLALSLEKIFSWKAPDNLLAGQNYTYELRIAKADSLRANKDILEDDIDSLHFHNLSSVQTGAMNYYMNVKSYFPTGQDFIWQVKAFTNHQEIAKSRIQNFGGPPCIIDFLAADYYVGVTYTDGCNLTNISGNGKVDIDVDGNTHDVVFNNVQIVKKGVQYYLQSGEVLADAKDMNPIRLSAEYRRNGDAWFYPDSIKLTPDDYMLKGHIEWAFPHAVNQDEAPVIKTVTDWLIFDKFKLLGPIPFIDSISFDLLDPLNFTIEFTKGSRFFIRGDNKYFIDFNGNILFPENIGNLAEVNTVVPFSKHKQIYNIHSDKNTVYSRIKVADKTTLTIQPKEFVFDLDNDASPQQFINNPLWRGFYINKGKYFFNGDLEFSKQLGCNQEISVNYNFDISDSTYAYVIHDGLWAQTDIDFKSDNNLFFNTFPAELDIFSIKIEGNETKAGFIDGSIAIPLLDDANNFNFTSELNQFGFMPGYLHEELENRTFEYNAGADENLLLLTFTRGFFADNNRLETTVTIDWPYLDLSFDNIPMFRIWGNYDIGFGAPNAAFSLSQQMQTMLKGYEMTIDGIGAGRQANAYAIGTTAKMVMAEDASGKDGPPTVNFYSIFESSKINEQLVLSSSDEYKNSDQSVNSESSGNNSSVGQAFEGHATIGDAEAMMAKYKQEMEDAEAQAQALIPRPTVGKAEPQDNLTRDFAEYIPTPDNSEFLDNPTDALSYQDLIDIIDYITPFLEEEQQKKIQGFKELLVSFSPDEINAFIEKFSDIRALIGGMIQEQIDVQIAKITKPLKIKVDALNEKIEKGIMNGTDSLLTKLEKGIDVPINGFVDIALKTINASSMENKAPLIELINKVSASSRKSLKTELRRSVRTSVHKNIVIEATGIVDTILYTGSVLYLANSLSQNSTQLLTNSSFSLSDIDIDFDGMVQNNIDLLQSRITFEYFSDRITSTIDDAISGFNWNNVKDTILKDLIGGSVEAFIEGKITDAVTDAFGNTAGAVVGGLAKNVDMDFSNLGQKLKDGDLSGIITFDPSYIVIITPVVDLEGYVRFTNDDPIWGDSFQANLNATIKKPIELNAFATFINGTKPVVDVSNMSDEEKKYISTYKFWFIEAGIHGFSIPITPIPLALTGFEGKVYHHMKRQEDMITYYPNDSIRFGVGARVFMVDAGSNGKIATFDIGLELQLMKGGFAMGMDGNAYIANAEVSVSKDGAKSGGASSDKDKKSISLSRSIVLANGFMSYNSIEKHFLASMRVTLNTSPILCAGGGMLIDISKEWWQFAIGTRDDPIFIALLCKDTVFKGWFDINKVGLDIGLMTQLHLNLRSPWIDLSVVKFQGWFVFDLDFQAELIVFWQPKFTIQKGYVFLEFYAGVGVDYKTAFTKVKTFTIAAINLGGELEFASVPEAYLKGEVHGAITIMNIKAGMSLAADIKF